MTPTYKGFDQILTEYVGGRGRYQLKITLLMTPLYWLTLPLLFLIVFSAYVPKHRCKVSACENITEKVSFIYLLYQTKSKYVSKYKLFFFRSLQTSFNLNSSNLSGDIYINFFLYRTVAMLQIPIIIAPSFFFGLRISFSALQVLLGISCITLAFIPRDQTTAVLVFYLFSVLVASTCKKL